jgi:N-methylhydantoinase B
MDPVELELYKHRFSAIAEEMGAALKRTAFSPNIKERQDFSCAVFDQNGRMVSQAAHIPVHLGSMPLSVESALAAVQWSEGDMVLVNDPFKGGTHLPDLTLVAPVFAGGEKPLFYVANRAHHADIGGLSPGSMPISTSIFQEGLIIPPVLFVSRDRIRPELAELVRANVRTPRERMGDFHAQANANRTGIRRLRELFAAFGEEAAAAYGSHLIEYAETLARKRISEIPDGSYAWSDGMEDDGQGARDIRIAAEIRIRGDRAVVDFTGTDDQVAGNINAVAAVTWSAVLYVFRCLVDADIPANAGLLAPIEVRTRPGSLVDAQFPAGVAAGNVETAQRIVDVLLGALSRAIPESIPAASQGSMNNIAIGGEDPSTGLAYTYYETVGGGTGASFHGSGESAVHSHMTNTANTPIEALEYAYPIQVTAYGIRKGSGGAGRNRGGDGIVRQLRMLSPAEVTVLSERRRTRPYGLLGGEPGEAGRNILIRNGSARIEPAKFHAAVSAGDELRIETPGGGGFGENSR